MVKLKHRGLLVLGINRKEMEALREGMPLPVPLVDLDPKLKGQMIMIIPGEDDQALLRVMNTVAEEYQNGATSPIEIAKTLPRNKLQ